MLYLSSPPPFPWLGKTTLWTVLLKRLFVQWLRRSPILTKIGGEGSFSVPGGNTGTGVQAAVLLKFRSPFISRADGGMISRPGWPGR